MPPAFAQRTSPIRGEEQFRLEDGQLIRLLAGARETRWPLGELKRATLIRQPIGGHARRLTLQLAFHRRRGLVLTSHSVAGLGRLDDRTAAFRAFALDLLDDAVALSPDLRLVRAGAVTADVLWLTMAALGCGALVVAASAMASGASALGLDLGARLVFLLLLISAALPWIGRGGAVRLDPDALMAD